MEVWSHCNESQNEKHVNRETRQLKKNAATGPRPSWFSSALGRSQESQVAGLFARFLLPAYRSFARPRRAGQRSTDAMMRELDRAMRAATIDCPVLGTGYPILDYFIYVLPLAQRVARFHGRTRNQN